MKRVSLEFDTSGDTAERIINKGSRLLKLQLTVDDSSDYISHGLQVASSSLKELDVSRRSTGMPPYTVYLGSLPQLERLHLSNGNFKLLFGFCGHPTFLHLTELSFTRCDIELAYLLSHIANYMEFLPNLKRLNVDFLKEVEVQEIFGVTTGIHFALCHNYLSSSERLHVSLFCRAECYGRGHGTVKSFVVL